MARRKKNLPANENKAVLLDQEVCQQLFEELPMIVETDKTELHTMDDFNIELFDKLANREHRPGPVNPTPVAVKKSLADAVQLLDSLSNYSSEDLSLQLRNYINFNARMIGYKTNNEILNSIICEVDNLVTQATGILLKEVGDCIYVHVKYYMDDPDAVENYETDISDNDKVVDNLRISINDLLNELYSKIVNNTIDYELDMNRQYRATITIGAQIVNRTWDSICDMRKNRMEMSDDEREIANTVRIAKYNIVDTGILAARYTEVLYNAVQMIISEYVYSGDRIKEFMYGADGDGVYHIFHEQLISIIRYAENTIAKYIVAGMLKIPDNEKDDCDWYSPY